MSFVSRRLRSRALTLSLVTVPPPSAECPRQEHDIVFLIDGSGSIYFKDFAKMLSFVKAVMSQFQRPSTQVCPAEGKPSVQGLPVGGTPGVLVEWPWPPAPCCPPSSP